MAEDIHKVNGALRNKELNEGRLGIRVEVNLKK